MQVWSCFEDLIKRKILVQSELKLTAQFKIYNFFSRISCCIQVMSSICLYLYVCFYYSIFFRREYHLQLSLLD